MIREFFVVRVYQNETTEPVVRNITEHILGEFPTEKQIEKFILDDVGCNGYAEVIKRYVPDVPFT